MINFNLLNLIWCVNRCKFDKDCIPYESYMKINPNSDLILNTLCISECDNLRNLKFDYVINGSYIFGGKPVWQSFENYTKYFLSKKKYNSK